MRNHKTKLAWCLSNEKRLKVIVPDVTLSQKHIEKAKHNLKAAHYNQKGGFEDWAVSCSYYAMYHAMLAILFKEGYESKNHECTINAIEYLIETKKINLGVQDIVFIRSTEQMTSSDAKALREEFQYGTKTQVNKVILDELLFKSKEIVEKMEILIR